MDSKVRFTILSLVFVLSTVFFWMMLNNYLLPSKAQLDTNMKVFISEKDIPCNAKGLCLAHIFGSTNTGVGVAGVQGSFRYSDNIDVLGLIQDEFCKNASFKLDTELGFRIDPASRSAEFALGALRKDDLLESGAKCITGVILQPKSGTTTPAQGFIQLADSPLWKAAGAQPLVVNADSSQITINITDNAPIPSLTPPIDKDKGCSTYGQGDCNCDGAIDLEDWENIRSSMNGEGATCDVNGDGASNNIDVSIWLINNEFIQ